LTKIIANRSSRQASIDGAMLVEVANPDELKSSIGDVAVTVGTVSIGNIPTVIISSIPSISGLVSILTMPAQSVTVGTVSVGNIPTVIISQVPSITGTMQINAMPNVVISGYPTVSVGNTPPFELSRVTAAKLWPTLQKLQTITIASGSVDYPAGSAISAATKYVWLLCANIAQVAMGATTNGSTGVMIGAGAPALFPVVYTNGGAADVLHAQSATAASVLYVTEMSD
jgi:hypothetical protein